MTQKKNAPGNARSASCVAANYEKHSSLLRHRLQATPRARQRLIAQTWAERLEAQHG